METNKHRHERDTQRIKEIQKKMASGVRWGVGAPPAPPLGMKFCPRSFACMGILMMLVSACDSTRSTSDRVGFVHDHGESKEYS
jgi:hypothetical protein